MDTDALLSMVGTVEGIMVNERLSVLIIEDRVVIRHGLRYILRTEPDISIVGEIDTTSDALPLASSLRPAVVLADIARLGNDGQILLLQIQKETGARCLVFAGPEDAPYFAKWMQAGGAGCISRSDTEVQIVKAIRRMASGGEHMSSQLRELTQDAPASSDTPLSARETQILSLIAMGFTGTEISNRLCISMKTIETHRAHIGRKLGVSSRAQLVQYAIDNGLMLAKQSNLSKVQVNLHDYCDASEAKRSGATEALK